MKFLFFFFSLPVFAAPAPTVEFAVKDGSGHRIERIVVQGARGEARPALAEACQSKACSCEVFFEEGVLEYPVMRVSPENNTVSCRTLLGMDPASVSHVRLKGPGFETRKIPVKQALTLSDVLGSLEQREVRKIYRYSCDRTFFEGQGVTPEIITCVAYQHLGLIHAKYDFYLYMSALENNFAEKGGDDPFHTAICGYAGSLRMSCSASIPELEFGMYGQQQGPFIVAVTLTSRPEGTQQSVMYGFAALPDAGGDCPTGLLPAAPYVAQPETIAPGRHGSLPSSFVNSGSLNNMRVSVFGKIEEFQVSREASLVPCNAVGDCSLAQFQEAKLVQSVPYTRLTPVVCVLPRHLLVGL